MRVEDALKRLDELVSIVEEEEEALCNANDELKKRLFNALYRVVVKTLANDPYLRFLLAQVIVAANSLDDKLVYMDERVRLHECIIYIRVESEEVSLNMYTSIYYPGASIRVSFKVKEHEKVSSLRRISYTIDVDSSMNEETLNHIKRCLEGFTRHYATLRAALLMVIEKYYAKMEEKKSRERERVVEKKNREDVLKHVLAEVSMFV